MRDVTDGQWFITADGQVLQAWVPEGRPLQYLRYPTTRTVTLDDLAALDARSAELVARANKPRAGVFGGRRARAALEQAYRDAGLEGAAVSHTVRHDEARSLIEAEGTVASGA